MYYLIVGTNKILKGEIIEDKGDWFKLKEDNFDYSLYINKWTPVDKKYIKKQSENLLDLVEVGDLIEQFWKEEKSLGVNGKWIEQVHEKNSEYIGTYAWRIPIDDNDIKAIYKPNDIGDYKKVWEVLNNEQH